MVVLAASVVTKSGKALASRQFVDMSRIRIEGLLAAFPKLVGTGKQHTYVETEHVRYLYQPLENMYLVLVTNKASNILEDLETLRLLGKVVPEAVAPLDEDGVAAGAFDLLFAFDEVVAQGGHKENVTVPQVRQNTAMESHEEKLHKMIIQSKINETKDLMKKKAHEIERARQEGGRGGPRGGPPGGGMPSVSYGAGGGAGDAAPSFGAPPPPPPPAGRADAGGAPRRGMRLGGTGKGGRDFMASLKAEGEAVEDAPLPLPSDGGAAAPVVTPTEPVFVAVEERLSATLSKDGGLDGLEVVGAMTLTVSGEAPDPRLRVRLAPGAPPPGVQFKTHPNIDKALYGADGVLGLKDASRPFPAGAPLGVLKWRLSAADEALLPVTVNCWPSASGAETYVNIEYECGAGVDYDLAGLTVVIPLPPGLPRPPSAASADGDWRYDARRGAIVWTVDLVDGSNRSGAAEFVVPVGAPAEAFFPVEVSFTAETSLCGVAVGAVEAAAGGAPVKYGARTVLSTERYVVE